MPSRARPRAREQSIRRRNSSAWPEDSPPHEGIAANRPLETHEEMKRDRIDNKDLPGISANAGENGPRPVRRPRNPGMLAPKNGRADNNRWKRRSPEALIGVIAEDVQNRTSSHPSRQPRKLGRSGGYPPEPPQIVASPVNRLRRPRRWRLSWPSLSFLPKFAVMPRRFSGRGYKAPPNIDNSKRPFQSGTIPGTIELGSLATRCWRLAGEGPAVKQQP